MADLSFRDVLVKGKIEVCKVEPLNKMTKEDLNKKAQEQHNDITQEERAKEFNKGLEEIFLFDLLTK